jgi:hypothetical protein
MQGPLWVPWGLDRMNHPSEFTFVLPKGYVDREGRLHREGAMRLATAADELLPMQDARVRANRNYLVVLLLSRVITRLGTLPEEELTPGVVEAMYSADVAYLQDFYRRLNQTGGTAADTCCPSCGSALYVEMPGARARPA